ncbi:HopJ type III effector protein [Catenovulum maritimum]|uniref:Type III effector n=1 Tax=Catenovulum maritimum TaxID=1513271 RepID=A0A0J8GQS4_9ALTE|nr:HopJ type III effector protein [Catenovulum maritimum]KMT65155.1 type III effector [Catenovulum maritimum]
MKNTLIQKVKTSPNAVEFSEVIETIDSSYEFTPTEFANGDLVNQAGQNNGSCKIFAFAKLNQLSDSETLALFGHYYRQDVLENPEADDHQNIRNFIKNGWSGISFTSDALTEA